MSTRQRRKIAEESIVQQIKNNLSKLLGEAESEADENDLRRKELERGQKAVFEELQEKITTLISEVTDSPPEGLAEQILQAIIGTLANAEVETDVPEEMPEDAIPEEEMAFDDEEEEDEEMVGMRQFKELTTNMAAIQKSLSVLEDEIGVANDIAELVPAFVEMAEAVTELAPLAKEAPNLKELSATVKKLEKIISGRPRQASRDDDTEIDVPEEIKSDMEKNVEGNQQMVLGIPVKS